MRLLCARRPAAPRAAAPSYHKPQGSAFRKVTLNRRTALRAASQNCAQRTNDRVGRPSHRANVTNAHEVRRGQGCSSVIIRPRKAAAGGGVRSGYGAWCSVEKRCFVGYLEGRFDPDPSLQSSGPRCLFFVLFFVCLGVVLFVWAFFACWG